MKIVFFPLNGWLTFFIISSLFFIWGTCQHVKIIKQLKKEKVAIELRADRHITAAYKHGFRDGVTSTKIQYPYEEGRVKI